MVALLCPPQPSCALRHDFRASSDAPAPIATPFQAVKEMLQERRHTGEWKAQTFYAGVAIISDLEVRTAAVLHALSVS